MLTHVRTKISSLLAVALIAFTPLTAVADDGDPTPTPTSEPSAAPTTPARTKAPSATPTSKPSAAPRTPARTKAPSTTPTPQNRTSVTQRKASAPKPARVSVTIKTAGTVPAKRTTKAWGTASGAPNSRVFTQVRLPNGSWSTSQVGTTNSSGYYALPLTYGKGSPGYTSWRVGVATPKGTVYSSTAGLRRVTVNLKTAATKPVGQKSNAWGTAAGAPNARVALQVRLPNGSWSTSRVGTTNSKGAYTLPLTYGANNVGTYTYRAVVTVNGTRIYSPVTQLRRTPKASHLDRRCLSGRVMCASKKDRKLYWVINGRVQRTFDARYGCARTPSDNGTFRVYWKSYNHTSTIYGTWMPRAMFYNGGEAVHYSQDFRSRGYAGCSGGCINIRDWNGINWLYGQVRNGDKVVVY